MARQDGQVTGSTRILNNGPNASRYNIVLLAEGFTADQQGDFDARCEEFVAALAGDKWLRGLAPAINVHRVNVESEDEGTDDPDTCSGGAGDEVDTFFDSSLCTGFPDPIRRLMHFDTGLAAEVCDDEVPEWDLAIVVVNSATLGGAGGGRIAITTTAGDWTPVALHELGHSAFGLADEYPFWSDCDEEGHDHPWPGLEPWEPNVTRALHGFPPARATEAGQVKWGHLIAPATGVPTLLNADCGDCPSGANPLTTRDEIGLFEGAQYHHCDLFRPAFDCRMRTSSRPYCLVCVEAAHRVLRPHLPDGARVVAEVDEVDLEALCSGATRTEAFRVANLGTVFGEVTVATTVGQLQAELRPFGVQPGTLTRDGGLIPGQAARVSLTFGPLDLPSTESQRDVTGEVRVLVDGAVQVALPFRVSVHTPRAGARIAPTVLDFGDVAVGLTMYRRLRIGNDAGPCPLTLDVIVDQLTGPFAFPGTIDDRIELSVAGAETRDVYVRFTAAGPAGGTASGSLRVRTSDPARPLTTVTLQARVVAPVPVDSVLVLDRSGSMAGETGEEGRQKIDHAMFAVDLYASLLRDDDRIGLVRFNQHATAAEGDLLVDLAPAGTGGRAAVRDVLAQGPAGPLAPSGQTSIGAGLLLGSETLGQAVSDRRAILLLTDGRENRGATIDEARTAILAQSPPQRIFAVGFGLDQLTAAVVSASTETGGAALVTGDVVADKEFLLQKLFVQILSDEASWSMLADPVRRLPGGESARTRVAIGETDLVADFIVAFRPGPAFPKYLRSWLRLPGGTVISRETLDQAPGVRYTERGNHLVYRVPLPPLAAEPRAHLGRWEVWVANDAGPAGAAPPLTFAVMARAYSDLRLDGRLTQRSHAPGTPMEVVLRPILFGVPAQADDPVRVRVLRPDGERRTLDLAPAQPGVYRGVYRDTHQVGPYHFDCTAAIRTPSGIPVTRTRYLGGVILPPPKGAGSRPPREPREEECRRLVAALEEALRRLRAGGL